MPELSIIMPCRNAAGTIVKAVESVLSSRHRDFEFLVIDDHSTDDTRDRVIAAAGNDPRVSIRPAVGSGIVAALNTGLQQTRSAFTARMDADDRAHPDRFDRQLTFLREDPGCHLVSCRVHAFPTSAITTGMRRYLACMNRAVSPDAIFRHLFHESPLPHPSVMFRTETVRQMGGYREYDGPEDYDLWLRMAENGCRMNKIPRVLLDWRIHPRSLSRTDPRYRTAAFRNRKLAFMHRFLTSRRIPETREIWIGSAGKQGGRIHRYLQEHHTDIAGYVDIDPGKHRKRRNEKPVLAIPHLDTLPRTAFFIFAIDTWNAAAEFRRRMKHTGRKELRDFICL